MEAVKKAHAHATVTDTVTVCLRPQSTLCSDSVTESVSVTSVRAMCLYLDNHSISTISENELVYLPSGDADRPNTDKSQPTCLRPCCCLYSHYHKCLLPTATLHYISVCYTINKLTNTDHYCVSLCYLFYNKMMNIFFSILRNFYQKAKYSVMRLKKNK